MNARYEFKQVKAKEQALIDELKDLNAQLKQLRDEGKHDSNVYKSLAETKKVVVKKKQEIEPILKIVRAKFNKFQEENKIHAQEKREKKKELRVQKEQQRQLNKPEKVKKHKETKEVYEDDFIGSDYTFPLLSPLEHFVGKIMNEAFKFTKEISTEIREQKRQQLLFELVN